MADADRFLFEALEQSGCYSPTRSTDIADVKELSSDALVTIVWRCLAKIEESEPHLHLGLPTTFDAPVGVAAKHRVGSQLANTLKELGYAGDCGYNHFLYPNEKETRNILSWLVGKLPRVESETRIIGGAKQVSQSKADCLSNEAIACVFSAWTRQRTLHVMPNRDVPKLRGFEKLPLRTATLSLPWLESSSADKGFLFDQASAEFTRGVSVLEAMAVMQRKHGNNMDAFDDTDDIYLTDADLAFGGKITPNEYEKSASGVSADAVELPDVEYFGEPNTVSTHLPPFFVSAANVIRENELANAEAEQEAARQAELKRSHDAEAAELQLLKEETEQAQLEHIHVRLLETQRHIDKMREELHHDQESIVAIQQRLNESKSRCAALTKEVTMTRQLLSMLPQANDHIAKLKDICLSNESKLKELETEWEAHRAPLIEEERALLAMKSTRKARCRQFVAEMKVFRAEMKEMAAQIQEKMDSLTALDKAYAKLPRNLNRNAYTNRIMDIIKQVHKQKQDIGRIIEDIKAIQKQLNFSAEKLKRSEAVTDEKLYTEACKHATGNTRDSNSPYVECYRKFAQVRELFEELILVVGDVGKKENTARDLENWITQLQGRDSSTQLDKVLSDLESVRLENASLMEQLRAMRGSV